MNINRSPNLLTAQDYILEVSKMIQESRKIDASVIPHSEEELLSRYESSLLCVNKEGNIIGHIALYRTEIEEIMNLNIGEMGSVIVKPEYRGKNIGEYLTHEGVQILGSEFDALVAATINPIMVKMLSRLGFIASPFPKTCYEGGKKYLAPLMKKGDIEFEERARFFIQENQTGIKDKIIDLISQAYVQ